MGDSKEDMDQQIEIFKVKDDYEHGGEPESLFDPWQQLISVVCLLTITPVFSK